MEIYDSPITQIVSEIRYISEQISLLIKSAEIIFKKNEFEPSGDTTVAGDKSGSLNNPNHWFPEFFCRFYTSDIYKEVQMYFSVILDNRDKNRSYDFKKPIVSAGYFLGHKNPSELSRKRCTSHVYADNKNYEGRMCVFNPDNIDWKKENKNFSILKSNAFYLEDITSSEVLETKLLKPFFDDFKSEYNNYKD